MEYLLGFLFDLLVGSHASLKQHLAALGVLTLSFVAFVAFWAYGSDAHQGGSYFILMIIAILGAVGLFILLVSWRIQGAATYIRQSRRPSDDAYAIIEELRASGILTHSDSPLTSADWAGVKLRNANLHNANFNKTGLEDADLRQSNLSGANLRSARLQGANLSEADLSGANLCYAGLQKTNLQQAQLAHTDLSAADLSGALLQGASLKGAHFDQHTTLPDGHKWTPKTDWIQFGVEVSPEQK